MIQYIGRVQRSELTSVIYDYRDINIDYLNAMFFKRNVYYKKLIRHRTLFDDVIEEIKPVDNSVNPLSKAHLFRVHLQSLQSSCFCFQLLDKHRLDIYVLVIIVFLRYAKIQMQVAEV